VIDAMSEVEFYHLLIFRKYHECTKINVIYDYRYTHARACTHTHTHTHISIVHVTRK